MTTKINDKIRIHLKDSDALYEAVGKAVRESLPTDILDGDECDLLVEGRQDTLYEKFKKWFTYGELVTLEYDPVTDTLKVLEADQ